MNQQNVMQTIFVTGTDTNVGKTYITCLLIKKLRATGMSVGAYKPVCSGAERNAEGQLYWSDVEALRSAAGQDFPIDLICPQRFAAAVAPNVAAELEGSEVSDDLLLAGVFEWATKVNTLIIEGAGGILCPLSNELSVLDLATQIKAPVIVVAANRIGVISHTRLTVDRLRHNGLEVAAVILNDLQTDEAADASVPTNSQQIAQWLPDVALLHLPYQSETITILSNGRALTNPLLASVLLR